MSSKKVSGIMLTLLLVSIFTLAFDIQPVKGESRTWYVDDDGTADFSSIQEAIDSPEVMEGDTLYIYNGTYYEKVVINKNNLALIGENNKGTTIDGPWGNVVSIVANNVHVANFRMQGGSSTPSERWSLAHIYIGYNSHGNIIENNICGAQSALDTGSYNNTFYNNTCPKFWVYKSNDNVFNANVVSGGTYGFHVYESLRNTIGNNTISNCWNGIRLMPGIGSPAMDTVISLNSISFCWCALFLGRTQSNLIVGNNIFKNDYGTGVFSSTSPPTYFVSSNLFYHNDFIDNKVHAYMFYAIYVWDNGYPSGGNYWSDYTDVDLFSGPNQDEPGSDGIWDHPYVIEELNQDNYPLVEPWSHVEPDFEISVLPQPSVTVHVGGWNDSTSLRLRSVYGFEGSITLGFEPPSGGIFAIEFATNPVFLPKDGEISVGMTVRCDWAPLSIYAGSVVASSDAIDHDLDLEITVIGNSAAIMNIINIDEVNVELNISEGRFRWLSVQQNFYVAASNGSTIYWAQNIVEVWVTGILWIKHIWIRSVVQVFPYGSNDPVLNTEPQTRFSRTLISEPFVFNLTSYIEEDLLILENNASRGGAAASLAIPEDSYIVGMVGFDAPQVCLVGTAQVTLFGHPLNAPIAVFEYPTSGQVESYSKLVGEDTWRLTVNRVFGIVDSQTAEQSRNLTWWSDGAFLWNEAATDQGISFTPNYETPP